MYNTQLSSITMHTSCLVIAIAIIVWKMLSKRHKVSPSDESDSQDRNILKTEVIGACPELPNPNWLNIGHVKDMFIYPTGTERSCSRFKFTQHGISMTDNELILTDKMFLVLNVLTKKFESFWNYNNLAFISITTVNNSEVELAAPDMPSIFFKIDEETKKTCNIYYCPIWQDSTLKCIDCGAEVNKWLNRYLKSTNLRLIQTNYGSIPEQTNVKENWARYVLTHTSIEKNNPLHYPNLTHYVVMTSRTHDQLYKETNNSDDALSIRPNIVVLAPSFPSFVEDKWEWIKIGNTVMRKIIPVPRYIESNFTEPREYDGESHFGIYYGLYVPGYVNIGDDVFIHYVNKNYATF